MSENGGVCADVVRRLLEIHSPVVVHWGDAPDSLACKTCGSHFEYPVDWPCETARLLGA